MRPAAVSLQRRQVDFVPLRCVTGVAACVAFCAYSALVDLSSVGVPPRGRLDTRFANHARSEATCEPSGSVGIEKQSCCQNEFGCSTELVLTSFLRVSSARVDPACTHRSVHTWSQP